MLFQQRIKNIKLSTTENNIIQFILEHSEDLENYSIRDLAKLTFSSTSTIIRLAKKLGYIGYEELKKDYIEETHYLQQHFTQIDANIPFNENNRIMDIAAIQGTLMKETADDTLSLLTHDLLQKATSLLTKADTIYVYGAENNNAFLDLFKYKLLRINKKIIHEHTYGNQMYTALQATPNDCVILISYSGESSSMVKIAKELGKKKIPIITLTCIGNNTVNSYASCALFISTREKMHSKIGSFSTEYSISLILNILYSTLFARNYQDNLELKFNRTKYFEGNRKTNSMLLKEDEYEKLI